MAREGSLLVSIFYRGGHAVCPPRWLFQWAVRLPPSLAIKLEICGAWPQWGPAVTGVPLRFWPRSQPQQGLSSVNRCRVVKASGDHSWKHRHPPPPNTPQKQRPLEVAGKLVIDRCERPLVDACQRELKMEEERQLWRWKADTSLIGSEQSCRKCAAESATVSIRSLSINHMGRNTGECNLG